MQAVIGSRFFFFCLDWPGVPFIWRNLNSRAEVYNDEIRPFSPKAGLKKKKNRWAAIAGFFFHARPSHPAVGGCTRPRPAGLMAPATTHATNPVKDINVSRETERNYGSRCFFPPFSFRPIRRPELPLFYLSLLGAIHSWTIALSKTSRKHISGAFSQGEVLSECFYTQPVARWWPHLGAPDGRRWLVASA